MASKRKKPYDPAAAARHKAEREANAQEVNRLRAQPSTAVNVDKTTGRLTGAWRLNCFNTLLPQKGQERAAIDWLEELVRTANGENSQERRPDFVRASTEGAPGQNITDGMIAASFRLSVVLENMAPAHGRMLMELLKPDADLITRWRAVVQSSTGETHSHAQAATVRAACTSLVWVRDNIGRLERAHRETRRAA